MNKASRIRRAAGPAMFAQLVVVAAAALIAVLAAPFGTAPMPALERLVFWAAAIGFNAAKWWLWYRFVAPRAGPGWQAQVALALGGAILLNLTLPFEIGLLFRLLGEPFQVSWPVTFASALAISLAISLVLAVARPEPRGTEPTPAPATVQPISVQLTSIQPTTLVSEAPSSGLATRAGVDLSQIHAIVAEDHYLRLTLANGRTPLILYRFGDAVRDLAAIDGTQIHRGAWVAAAAVTGARRDGRKWRLCLAGGATLPVSDSFLAPVRARGWLARPLI